LNFLAQATPDCRQAQFLQTLRGQTPKDLQNHPSLFIMMRTGVTPVRRLRHANNAKPEMVMRLTPAS
jgi:hypothetical protein